MRHIEVLIINCSANEVGCLVCFEGLHHPHLSQLMALHLRREPLSLRKILITNPPFLLTGIFLK